MPLDRRSPTIIVDSREKRPLDFSFTNRRVTRKALQTGDYTIFGYGQLVVVEYKSLPDWYSWISFADKRRFESQVHRLLTIPYRCVVVGGRLGSPLARHKDGSHRAICIDRALERAALVTAMGIPVIFCSGRKQAARFTYKFLEEGVKLC